MPKPWALFLDQVYLLKTIPLRLYVNVLAFTGISFGTSLDWTNVSVYSEKVLVFMSLVLLYDNIFKNMGCCIGDLGYKDIFFMLSYLGGPLALSISLVGRCNCGFYD